MHLYVSYNYLKMSYKCIMFYNLLFLLPMYLHVNKYTSLFNSYIFIQWMFNDFDLCAMLQ